MSVVKEGLIKALGIGGLPDDMKIAILEESAELVEGRVMLRLMNSLPDDKKEKLNNIIAAGKMDELEKFVADEAPEFENWLIEEAEQLKEELKSLGEPEV